ncbi:hypothetical protein R3P38DRAFT_3038602 [Favolaschia claudopus]|uniref:DUF7729 domain-containing protein n=1 Tax=Favolaschia claudopus TaxID=2862362 RepID=A0AAW0A941_9AGAR
MKASTFVTFAAAAGLASAQSLSTGCTNSLKVILGLYLSSIVWLHSVTGHSNLSDAACLNPSSLLSFFVGNAQSVPDTVDNWLTGLCPLGFCSDESLAAVVANVTAGCANDFGMVDGLPETVTKIVQEVYPTARSIACLKDNASQKLCVTQTLNNLQDIVGKLSFTDFSLNTAFADFQKILVGAKNLACTSCTKAAFRLASQMSLVSQFLEAQQQAASQIDAICGANFIEDSSSDSQDNVSQTATNEAFVANKPNSALSLTTSKAAGALILFFSAFTLLG